MTSTGCVILAAGKGTRMRSDRPKVLHEAAGRPLVAWVADAAAAAGCEPIVVVVGHGADEVRRALGGRGIEFVEQREQRGTGHALAQAREAVAGADVVLVLSGDVPMVRPSTLRGLLEAAEAGHAALAVATVDEPARLGRVLERDDGGLARIVEAADASADELAIRRINAGLYALPVPEIFERLDRLTTDNAQGELYLTDAVTAMADEGHRVAMFELDDLAEAHGVNTRVELAEAHRQLTARAVRAMQLSGVTIVDPSRIEIGPEVTVAPDCVLHPDVALHGSTTVERGAVLHQGAWVRDSEIGERAEILPYSVIEAASVGASCRVGPMARLRPGAELGESSRVGNFVEVKNSRLGPGAKAGHLAYLGDAEVGAGANIGAGAVTCNYDGTAKHRTTIGAGAFVGSDTMLVAPVEIGEGATTAAGSVVTRDVPEGALAVGRARQRNVEGWSERRERPKREES